MRKLTFIVLLILIGLDDFNSLAQAPSIDWQRCLGGSDDDFGRAICPTSDGGYIMAGESKSEDNNITGHPTVPNSHDYWVVKTNITGNIEWQKSLGGNSYDYATAIEECTDGGYIVGGYSFSANGDITNSRGGSDYWIVKLNNSGDVQWQKSLGSSHDDKLYSIHQTADGGFIAAGYAKDLGDVTGNHGEEDFWVVKLFNNGDIEWEKSLGGSSSEWAYSIQQTFDGGYIVAGGKWSGDWDGWIVKLNNVGDIVWQKLAGGAERDMITSIYQTSDSGYIAAGFSESSNGDFAGHHGNNTHADGWLMKLDSSGDIEWQKLLGGSIVERFHSVIQTGSDGGYIIAGYASSDDGDISEHLGLDDFWILKTDSIGDIQWEKSLGGSNSEIANSIQLTDDGWYIILGYSDSDNGSVSGNNGYYDYWVVKLGGTTGIEETIENLLTIYPNPVSNSLTIETASGKGNYQLRDVTGKVLLSGLASGETKFSLDISALSNGIYLLNFFDGTHELHKKVVKQ